MPVDTVIRAFVDAINAHDVERILALCSPDHAFVDAHGNIVPAERLREAWTGYFGFMPRYGIAVDEMVVEGDTAALFGFAWGGLAADGTRDWRRPAAWRVRVEQERIRLWQVYVDTKIVFDLLASPP